MFTPTAALVERAGQGIAPSSSVLRARCAIPDFVSKVIAATAQEASDTLGNLSFGLTPRQIQLDSPGTLKKSAQKSAAAERFPVVLTEAQSLLVEPVGIVLGEDYVGLKVHATLLIAGSGAIVKSCNCTTTHLWSGPSDLAEADG